MRKVTRFQKKVYNFVKKIPRGKVVTYASIAEAIGNRRAVRAIGSALHRNPYRIVPCHRVIRLDGLLGGYARGVRKKLKLLQEEGVEICRGKVDPRFIIQGLK